jgi:hypothetical protein
MNQCPGTDALTTIAGALEWDVEAGIRHLSTCDACERQLRALREVRVAYEIEAPLPPHVAERITTALRDEAAREERRTNRAQNAGNFIEAILAGGTALAVVNTGGVDVPPALSAGVFAVVATSLFAYRAIRSSH